MKKHLLILFLISLSHLVVAQQAQPWLEKRISISIQDKAIETVLKSLEKDLPGMAFAYLPGSFDMEKKVTIKRDSVPLREVLEELFTEQEMECTEMRGKIFLKKKKTKPQDKSGQPVPKRRKRVVPVRPKSDPVVTHNEEADQAEKGAAGGTREVQSREGSEQESAELSRVQAANTSVTDLISQAESLNAVVSSSATPNETKEDTTSDLDNPDAQVLNSRELALVPEILQVKWNPSVSAPTNVFGEPYIPSLAIEFSTAEPKKPFFHWLQWPEFLSKNPDKATREKKAGNAVNSPDESPRRGIRGYLATGVGVSPLGSENGIKIGGRVVWQRKPSLGLGFGGYAVIGSSMTVDGQPERFRIAGGYGGFHMEYSLSPDKPLHLSFPILVGLGEITYVNTVNGLPLPNITEDGTQVIFVLEPGAMLEMNVFSFMRLGLDVTYRYTTNSELKFSNGDQLLGPSDMNGISAGITIKIGRF